MCVALAVCRPPQWIDFLGLQGAATQAADCEKEQIVDSHSYDESG